MINHNKKTAYTAEAESGIYSTTPNSVAPVQVFNNVVEQDHRTVKKRVGLAKGYGSFATAWRTLQGIEAVNMIRKGRARWVAKGDTMAQAGFISALFGIAA
jgi:IS6 family transposase